MPSKRVVAFVAARRGVRPRASPTTAEIRNSTTAMKKMILAISIEAPAMPPKPKMPAINATTRNVTTQPSMTRPPFVLIGSTPNAAEAVASSGRPIRVGHESSGLRTAPSIEEIVSRSQRGRPAAQTRLSSRAQKPYMPTILLRKAPLCWPAVASWVEDDSQ